MCFKIQCVLRIEFAPPLAPELKISGDADRNQIRLITQARFYFDLQIRVLADKHRVTESLHQNMLVTFARSLPETNSVSGQVKS